MFAVVKSGGRQYKVTVGEQIQVNRLFVEVGDQVRLDEVLLIADGDNTQIGTPLVSNALVLATATEQGRGEKLIVFKYKSKKRYRHKRGHRQELTFLTIDDIVTDGKSLITGKEAEFRERSSSIEDTAVVEEAATSAPVIDETPVEKKPSRRRTSTKSPAETSESVEKKALASDAVVTAQPASTQAVTSNAATSTGSVATSGTSTSTSSSSDTSTSSAVVSSDTSAATTSSASDVVDGEIVSDTATRKRGLKTDTSSDVSEDSDVTTTREIRLVETPEGTVEQVIEKKTRRRRVTKTDVTETRVEEE